MRRTRRAQGGTAFVELALLLPVLALLFVGIIHFGYAFYVYSRVEKAVHDAARYASIRTLFDGAVETYKTQVRNTAVYGEPTGVSSAVVPNLTTSQIEVIINRPSGLASGRPQSIQVGVTTYTIPGTMGLITLTNKPRALYPFLGRYTPAST